MSLNSAYVYLISKATIQAFSESIPESFKGACICFRLTGSTPVTALSKTVLYEDYKFNAIVRGTEDSVYTTNLVDANFNAIHMSNDLCTASDKVQAFTDDNGLIHYSFNISLTI